jgi:hypothetical protein
MWRISCGARTDGTTAVGNGRRLANPTLPSYSAPACGGPNVMFKSLRYGVDLTLIQRRHQLVTAAWPKSHLYLHLQGLACLSSLIGISGTNYNLHPRQVAWCGGCWSVGMVVSRLID